MWAYTPPSALHAPPGDDPKTYNQVLEIQEVTCFATDGTFQLGFRLNNTRPTLWNVTAMGRTGSLQVSA